LICENSQGSVESFQKVGVYKNQEAISHLFRVGTGLDSQIWEILKLLPKLNPVFSQSKGWFS
jgi:glutamyl-tRNA reductase